MNRSASLLSFFPAARTGAFDEPEGSSPPLHTLRFGLPASSPVLAMVFATDGACVRELLRRELPAGEHVVYWDGLDAMGLRAPRGTYRLRLDVGTTTHVERPVVIA